MARGVPIGGLDMIIRPDFPYHWKTRLLAKLTSNPDSGMMLIRLWTHCQQVRSHILKISATSLAIICGWSEKPSDLQAILIECGFIEQDGECFVVHDWEKENGTLVASWNNGKKGGRPSGSKSKPSKTKKPMGSSGFLKEKPSLTQPSSLSSLLLDSKEGDLKGKPKSRCTQSEAEAFCESIGLPRSDGRAMFLHWEERGWKKVNDWRLTIRKWKEFGYLPSQRNGRNVHGKPERPSRITEAEAWWDKEGHKYAAQ